MADGEEKMENVTEVERRGDGSVEAVETERGRRGWAFWVICVFVAILVYVLSVGPVLRINSSLIQRPCFQAIYAPIFWLNGHSKVSRKCFNLYVSGICRAGLVVGE
jgi:hypothetical protein